MKVSVQETRVDAVRTGDGGSGPRPEKAAERRTGHRGNDTGSLCDSHTQCVISAVETVGTFINQSMALGAVLKETLLMSQKLFGTAQTALYNAFVERASRTT